MNVRMLVMAAAAAAVMAAAMAAAASGAPVKPQGRYVGVARRGSNIWAGLVLRVDRGGRRLSRWSGGSSVDVSFDASRRCAATGPTELSLAGVRVGRGGRLVVTRRRGGVSLRLSAVLGRRVSGRLRWRARRAKAGVCDTGWLELHGRLVPDPPFVRCRPNQPHTLVRTQSGVVFAQRGLEDSYALDFVEHHGIPEISTLIYACLYQTNERVLLGTRVEGVDYLNKVRMAGDFVAFSEGECPTLCGSGIRVVNVRRGVTVARPQATIQGPWLDGDLVLKPNGAIAFGYQAGDPSSLFNPSPTLFVIVALDLHGERTLDAGADVDIHSLRLSGSTLTWLRGGVTRTATLQ